MVTKKKINNHKSDFNINFKRIHAKIRKLAIVQSWTKYLRQTLVFYVK